LSVCLIARIVSFKHLFRICDALDLVNEEILDDGISLTQTVTDPESFTKVDDEVSELFF